MRGSAAYGGSAILGVCEHFLNQDARKLAAYDNQAIGLAKEQDTTTHTQMREEILQPTEDILKALQNQISQV
jgi:hypothetical protein